MRIERSSRICDSRPRLLSPPQDRRLCERMSAILHAEKSNQREEASCRKYAGATPMRGCGVASPTRCPSAILCLSLVETR